jgi:lipoyl-dependent peroxiredoxin subunit D
VSALDPLRERFPESARDTRLNLPAVLQGGALSVAQRHGVAVASAAAARDSELLQGLVAEARAAEVPWAVVEDALAAASLMAMNNVYYRFRHLSGNPEYSAIPARLRMNRLVKPAANKVDFELFCLAVSAINGCETCMQSHDKVVREGGLSAEQVHDAVRIAAVVTAAATSLELGSVTPYEVPAAGLAANG